VCPRGLSCGCGRPAGPAQERGAHGPTEEEGKGVKASRLVDGPVGRIGQNQEREEGKEISHFFPKRFCNSIFKRF
jgi:hypothetical protein